MITFLYDKKLKKIGCPILQRTFGATISNFLLHLFDTENWFTSPTEDMEVYVVRDELQLEIVINMTKGKEIIYSQD